MINKYTDGGEELSDLLNGFRNSDEHDTADYIAMQYAEAFAHEYGADLYQESAKISATAVDYNKKFRAQVEQYNAEYQNLAK